MSASCSAELNMLTVWIYEMRQVTRTACQTSLSTTWVTTKIVVATRTTTCRSSLIDLVPSPVTWRHLFLLGQ